jgi:flagellar basal-body rod modification protein FlgD
MQVDSTAASSNVAATTPATKPASSSIDYNTFLQLMIAEMKFQDPTNPTDTSQYMSQFAQFSSVEQGIKTNTKLDSLLSSQALSQADSLIGHTATSPDGSVTGQIASLTVSATGGATATLTDGRTLSLGAGVTIS